MDGTDLAYYKHLEKEDFSGCLGGYFMECPRGGWEGWTGFGWAGQGGEDSPDQRMRAKP